VTAPAYQVIEARSSSDDITEFCRSSIVTITLPERPSRSAQQTKAAAEIVADRCGRDAGFTHGVTDLVETEDNVTGRIQSWCGGALMRVNLDAAVAAARRPERRRQVRMDIRAEGWIDSGEGEPAPRCDEAETLLREGEVSCRPIDDGNTGRIEVPSLFIRKAMRAFGCDD
jgi:hypothetical protein